MGILIHKLSSYLPISYIFSFFHQEEQAVFLHTSLQTMHEHYSVIGLNPYLVVESRDGLYVNHKKMKQSFFNKKKKYFQKHFQPNPTSFPLICGAIGYFSYDFGRDLQNIFTRHADFYRIPNVKLVFYDNFIIENHKEKEVYLLANGKLLPTHQSIEQIETRIRNEAAKRSEFSFKLKPQIPFSIEYSCSREAYISAIEQMRQYMENGHIYVANLTQTLKLTSPKSPFAVFQTLQKINPASFAAYLNLDEFQIICASPERFIKIKDRQIQTSPIKGTRKRGRTPEEDAILKKELQTSEKDRSELLMIIDLERNDLNKVCIPGSVTVPRLFDIETYATVFHLVSDVQGMLKNGIDTMDVLKAAFPGGSITGAPKKRAMEIIDALETGRRGIYTGCIGYLSLNGDCDFNIVIRTLLHKEDQYYLGVGGGITYESDPTFEYDETLQKAKALIEALKKD